MGTYSQTQGDASGNSYFGDTLINPQTLADGSLFSALDEVTNPQVGTTSDPKTGALGTPVVTAVAGSAGTLPAAHYYYQVTATGVLGEGKPSTEVVTVTSGTSGSVVLSWVAAGGETEGYTVYRASVPGEEDFLASVGHGVLSFTDSGAANPNVSEPVRVEDQTVAGGEPENSAAPTPVDPAGSGDAAGPGVADEGEAAVATEVEGAI